MVTAAYGSPLGAVQCNGGIVIIEGNPQIVVQLPGICQACGCAGKHDINVLYMTMIGKE